MTTPTRAARSDFPAPPDTAAAETAPVDSGLQPHRRMGVFVALFTAILLVSTWFATATWRHFHGANSLASLLVPLGLTLSFVPAMLLSFGRRHPLLGLAYKIAAVSLGWLNFSLVAAVACWLAAGAAALTHVPLDPRLLATVLYAGAALATLYGLLNAAWLRVTRVTVPLAGLPAAWHGRTLALVSDVHLGNVRGADFVRRIVATLQPHKPDAVLLAGDMFDGADVDLATIAQPWSALSAPGGVYFVTGNHDEFSPRGKYLAALGRAGVRVLNNEKVVIDGLQLVGVHDGEAGEPAVFREILRRVQLDRTQASVLLTHQPANLTIPEEAGISLQVSGHTHGGQFWPWTKLVSRVHGRFAYGLNRLGSLLVFTSSGAGTWGPPLRVGTRSEIVLLRLESAAA